MLTRSFADHTLNAFADPDAAAHGEFRTSIFVTVLFSVLLRGFAAIAVLSLPIECVLSDSRECRATLFTDPM